jgi:hypothetical protein
MLNRIMPIPEALVFCADGPIQMAAMAGGAYISEKPFLYYRHHSTNLRPMNPEKTGRMRRGLEMNELAFELCLPVLARLGVRSDSARALVFPAWLEVSQQKLSLFGGNPLNTFQTEMRRFHSAVDNPSIGYRLFKYLIVGAATLLLPPRVFYKTRAWYGRQNLGRFRNRVFRQA